MAGAGRRGQDHARLTSPGPHHHRHFGQTNPSYILATQPLTYRRPCHSGIPPPFWRNEPNGHFANESAARKPAIHDSLFKQQSVFPRIKSGVRRTNGSPAETLVKAGRQRYAARTLRFSGAGRRPFPFFLLPCTQGKWSAGRRRGACEAPLANLARVRRAPCEGARTPVT
jgi:hypothetical protein